MERLLPATAELTAELARYRRHYGLDALQGLSVLEQRSMSLPRRY